MRSRLQFFGREIALHLGRLVKTGPAAALKRDSQSFNSIQLFAGDALQFAGLSFTHLPA